MKSKKTRNLTIFSVTILTILAISLIILAVYSTTGHYSIIKSIKSQESPAQHLTIIDSSASVEADVHGLTDIQASDLDLYTSDLYTVHVVFNDGSTFDNQVHTIVELANPQYRKGAVIERIVAQKKVTYTYNTYDRNNKLIDKKKQLTVINPTENIENNIGKKSKGNIPKVDLGIESPITYGLISPGTEPIKLTVKTFHYGMVGTLKAHAQRKFYDQELNYKI